MDGADQASLSVGKAPPICCTAAFPGGATTNADLQRGTHFRQRVVQALRVDPGMFHSASPAKYVVAFLAISFSARTRESSTCSGVTDLTFALPSRSASAALIQLRDATPE